ncbi:MAG: DUF3617 domain-containing protein [Sphingomonas sp.]
MRHAPFIVVAASVCGALAGCNQAPSVVAANASIGDVATKVAEAAKRGSFVSPGHWQSTVHFDKMDVPGMPPELAERMNRGMARARTAESCLTAEQAQRPNGGFFNSQLAKSCTYDHFSMANGVIDAALKCTGAATKQAIVMKGTFSPDTYQVKMDSQITRTDGGPLGTMVVAMTIDAKRTGPCTGKEQSKGE